MKILSVTIMPPKNDAQWTRISNIAKFLEKKGFEISIVHYILKGGKSYKDIKKESINGLIITTNPFSIFFKHIKILKKGEYDLVYGNTYASTFFCILSKLISKKPIILDMHGISEEYDFTENSLLFSFAMKFMEKNALLFADKVLCVSHEMTNYLNCKKKVPLEKLFYVPNGVDLDFFRQIDDHYVNMLKKKYKIEDKLIFGYLGGAQKWQGMEKFISTCEKITDEKFMAIIVGCNIPSITIDGNIIYIPFVKKDEIINYYSLCDVLVLPRPKHIVTDVAAPTKFAEYVSMGKPVLVTDVGDAAKLVKKYENGIVVKDNKVENLKKGINDFLKLKRDKLNQMGLNSRKLAEKEFDWNNIINYLSEILES